MKKGFTLIELLIVIAILAILTAAVVVVLNPAQLLAQARDSQRMSDTGSIRKAITLYLTTATSPTLSVTSTMMASLTSSTAIFTVTPVLNSSTTVSSVGWVAVALSGASGGSPLAALPVDPTNNATYAYAYCALTGNSDFEVNAALESTKYIPRMTSDGGNRNGFYEVGTNLSC